MSFFSGITLELGIGVAIGMLAGTTGLRGSARGRMTLLAAVVALVIGFLVAGPADLDRFVGALGCLVGAVVACVVVSDVVSGAGRREGGASGPLAFMVSVAGLIVAGVTLVVKPVGLLALLALLWLGLARRRRTQRKYEGLRVLR